MTIRVCLAGATGWAGSELATGIVRQAPDLELVAGVSRRHAGKVGLHRGLDTVLDL